jgi:hypothetical protein
LTDVVFSSSVCPTALRFERISIFSTGRKTQDVQKLKADVRKTPGKSVQPMLKKLQQSSLAALGNSPARKRRHCPIILDFMGRAVKL